MKLVRRVVLLIVALVVVATAHAEREAAPPPAWFRARVRLADPQLRATLDLLTALSPVVGELRRCGLDPQKGLDGIELSIGRKQLSINLRGRLPVTTAECALTVLRAYELGGTTLPQLNASATNGGVRISGPVAAESAPDDQPLGISPTALFAGSWRFGPVGARHQLDWEATSNGISKIRITCASAAAAKALSGWLVDAIARAVHAESLRGPEVKTEQRGKVVSIRIQDLGVPLALALRKFVVEVFNLPSSSMLPTLQAGDHVLIAKGALAGSAKRGDMIVFTSVNGQSFIKRVVAVGGDRVELQADQLSVNGKPVAQEKVTAERWRETQGDRQYEILRGEQPSAGFSTRVPDGAVFVLGDNRPNSYDSRFFGPVALSAVIGRMMLIYFSIADDGSIRWDRIGMFPD
jgi:signal peptidase I